MESNGRLRGMPLFHSLRAWCILPYAMRVLLAVNATLLLSALVLAQSQPQLALMPMPSTVQMGTGLLLIDRSFSLAVTGFRDASLDRGVQNFAGQLSAKVGYPSQFRLDSNKPTLTIHADRGFLLSGIQRQYTHAHCSSRAGANFMAKPVRTSRISSVFSALSVLFLIPALSPWVVCSSSSVIEANSNRIAGGTFKNGVLTLHLELRQGDWYPWDHSGPSLKVDAFGEEGKALQVPGPLIRVPEGTKIHVTIHNLLAEAAIVHGLHQHPGDVNDVVRVGPQEVQELEFAAGAPGTYEYWASAGGSMAHTTHGRPYREDSQLAGAFIVDPRGGAPPDRVFVLGLWRAEGVELLVPQIPVINGKSWPYTERLTYAAGEPVHWRWVNASDAPHPMHLHGSYYQVDSEGDGERDRMIPPGQLESVVTQRVLWGATMTTTWIPPAGRWLMHCHLLLHTRVNSPGMEAATGQGSGDPAAHSDHMGGLNHMGGMAMGITVTGKFAEVPAHGRPQKLRLLVRERAGGNGVSAGFSYQIEEGHRQIPAVLGVEGPPLVLEKGRPVEIDVVNRLHEPTTVHWHGIELQSFYDGVAGWDGEPGHVAPKIEPGQSFRVHFTPPRAGTFIYHTHLNDEVQISSGLCGPLIVLEPGAKFDPVTDIVFLVSRGGTDKLKSPLLLNGKAEPATLHWRTGQKYRLRFINITASNGAGFSLLGSSGVQHWRALAKDGADLPPARAADEPAKLSTLPGETYDFEFQPERRGTLTLEIGSNLLGMKITQHIEVE